LIGSPDHWHVPMATDACNAGKDVYVEKPLTHDLAEARRSSRPESEPEGRPGRDAATQHAHIQKARELVKDGRIGELVKVHLTWNRGGTSRFRRVPMGIDPVRSSGRTSSALPPTSRSTSSASATGGGSGTSAADCSPI